MINNLESIDRVIAKIIRDLGLGQDEIPHRDFIEWIADALEHIGSYYQNTQKECYIMIDDYEGHLPCDFYKMIRMLKGCSVDYTDGGFYGGTLVNLLNKLGVDYETLPAYERYGIIPVAGIGQPDVINILSNKLNGNGNLIGNPRTNMFTSSDYNINHNKITTAFRYGVIQLQYLAIPTDERGFPLVPDAVEYRDALFWKVAYHMSMRNPALLQNPQMRDMEYCRRMWGQYCVQARAAANMPDLEMTIRLKNNWLRLLNTTDDDRNLFANLGQQQTLRFNGRR